MLMRRDANCRVLVRSNSVHRRQHMLQRRAVARWIGICWAVTAVFVAGGCGGDGVDVEPAVLNAPARVQAVGPAALRTSFSYGRFGGRARGAIDYGRRKLLLNGKLPGLGTVSQVVDDAVVYFRLPRELFALKRPWVRIDLARPPQLGALGTIRSLAYNGPLSMIDQLRGAVATERLGELRIEGVPTTGYRVTIDLKRVVERTPEADRATVKLMIDHTIKEQAGRHMIATKVWLDAQGRVRRQVSDFKFGAQTYGFDVIYSDFGQPREIKAPHPSGIGIGRAGVGRAD